MTMNSKVVVNSIRLDPVNTRNGPRVIAELSFNGDKKQTFWLSEKQGKKLSDCIDIVGKYANKRGEIHIVLDDDRFVWCGVHTPRFSELDFLKSKFDVSCEPLYVERKNKEG